MAPLTRMRARQPGNVPHEINALYYGQRASEGGLLISEATQISQQGQGYPATPGIYSEEQVQGWQLVTDAVHAKYGLVFAQLWHVGRISHPSFQPGGAAPVAPSPIAAVGEGLSADWQRVPHPVPRALEAHEIPLLIADYKRAAENAVRAGFDGVELHAANGYLLDQFLRDGTNHRTDGYGGTVEKRARLLLETIDAVTAALGADRVGVRLSPLGTFNDMSDSDPVAHFRYIIAELDKKQIAYLHLIEARGDETVPDGNIVSGAGAAPTAALFRRYYSGVLIGAGGYTRETAQQAVAAGTVDAVAFGRVFIANPDLPIRYKLGAELNPYNRATFYGGGGEGYIDYPALEVAGARA